MKNFITRNLLAKTLILFAVFCMLLCSCGFKGPLYLPKKKPAASQPVKSASSPIKAASSPAAVKANSSGIITTPNESGILNKS